MALSIVICGHVHPRPWCIPQRLYYWQGGIGMYKWVASLKGTSSKSRWEGRSCRWKDEKCQSLALIGTMVSPALVCFLALLPREPGMTTFLFSNMLLLYSYVLRLRRRCNNVLTIWSSMMLHLGIREWSMATHKKNTYDAPLVKVWDYQNTFTVKKSCQCAHDYCIVRRIHVRMYSNVEMNILMRLMSNEMGIIPRASWVMTMNN